MLPSTATPKLMQKAKAAAAATEQGGLEKKLNDMKSYSTSAGTAAIAFGIAHIPIVGPVLAKGFDVAAGVGITKAYEKFLAEATNAEQRISYSLFLLERTLAAALRQSYNTLVEYDIKSPGINAEVNCVDCQAAFKEAYATYLASSCIDDIDKGVLLLEKLAEDLKAKATQMRTKVDGRETRLQGRIDNFRDNHPEKNCMGAQTCYWIKGAPTVFSSITNADL